MSPETLPLCDVSELFRRSWDAFRLKIWKLIAVGGLGGAVSLAAAILPPAAVALWWGLTRTFSPWGWGLAVLVSLSAVLWLVSWTQAAMMEVALDDADALDVVGSYRLSWPKVGAFSWVCLLFFVLICGGFFLFLIPGVIVGVSLALAPFVCLAEGLSGFPALERSWGLTKGRWLPMLGRLMLIGLVTTAASAVPVVGFLLSMAAAPLALLLTAELYRDAARTAPPAAQTAGGGRWAFGLCGLGLAVALMAAASGVSALITAWPRLQARAQGFLDHPLDPQLGQELVNVLQGGATPENLEKAAALIGQAQNQTSSAPTAVSTTTLVTLPAPAAPEPQR